MEMIFTKLIYYISVPRLFIIRVPCPFHVHPPTCLPPSLPSQTFDAAAPLGSDNFPGILHARWNSCRIQSMSRHKVHL